MFFIYVFVLFMYSCIYVFFNQPASFTICSHVAYSLKRLLHHQQSDVMGYWHFVVFMSSLITYWTLKVQSKITQFKCVFLWF